MARRRPSRDDRAAERRAQRRSRQEAASRDRRRRRAIEDPAALELRRKRWRGLIYGLLGLSVFAGIGAAVHYLRPLPYDEATLCPFEGVPHRSFVLIDRSDEVIGPDRLRQLIVEEAASLPIHGRLTLYEIDETGETITDALFDLCNPGRGDQVSPLYRNPRRVENRYQNEFKAPLDSLLRRLSTPMDADFSPIVESIAELIRLGAAAPGHGDGRDGEAAEPPSTRLLIASDFLQNTALYGSHYRVGDPLQVDAARRSLTLAQGARPPSIEAIVMQRNQHLAQQERAREGFWRPVFDGAGIQTTWR